MALKTLLHDPAIAKAVATCEVLITGIIQAWVDRNNDVDPSLYQSDVNVKREVSLALEDTREAIGSGPLQALIRLIDDPMNDCKHVVVRVVEQ